MVRISPNILYRSNNSYTRLCYIQSDKRVSIMDSWITALSNRLYTEENLAVGR